MLFAYLLDGFEEGGVIGVGFDTGKFDDLMLLKCIHHLVVDPIFFDRPATVDQHDFGFARNALAKFRDGSLAENDPRRIIELEIVHLQTPYVVRSGLMISNPAGIKSHLSRLGSIF